MIVGVTGHRPNKLALPQRTGYEPSNPLRDIVKRDIRSKLADLGATRGITGMAQGTDTWFAEVCVEDRIPFIAAVPFAGQASQWPMRAREQYRNLLLYAEDVVYVSSSGYARWKMQARNEWVVDHCEHLLAVWDGTPGGTANTVLYASREMRPISRIHPSELIREAVEKQAHV